MEAREEELDKEIAKLDNLDEDDLEGIRQQRKRALVQMQVKRGKWLALGHGEYSETSGEMDFFSAGRNSPKVVSILISAQVCMRNVHDVRCSGVIDWSVSFDDLVQVAHFYKPDTNVERSEIVDKHFQLLAKEFIDIRFIKVNVERHPFVTSRLRIYVIPSVSRLHHAHIPMPVRSQLLTIVSEHTCFV